ncbi:MAG TPA: hypothetical protein PKE12_01825 [Kiritimatiellia bacterium]|nr:hypothetical protein [Kiritimatiellia bacterium]
MNETAICLNCGNSEENFPLVSLRFRGKPLWVCTQCMPVVIHQPGRIAGKLPGAGQHEAASD